jgi:uncharacterized protein (TIGR02757 family)
MTELPEFNGIGFGEMYNFLEENYLKFNNTGFIEKDPVSIPRRFTEKRDIEIAGFLTATISWGRRDLILAAANKLIRMMGDSPFNFLMDADSRDIKHFQDFYYRTFQGVDCMYFLNSLKDIYTRYDSMECLVSESLNEGLGIKGGIMNLRSHFFKLPHQRRTEKHFANPLRGAAGKRLNMFFRWMIRKDDRGVDFGLWEQIPASELLIPLDFHSGNIARKLGLLKRNANDWKAVEELTANLRLFDADDPVKYDYALFGLGVNNMI